MKNNDETSNSVEELTIRKLKGYLLNDFAISEEQLEKYFPNQSYGDDLIDKFLGDVLMTQQLQNYIGLHLEKKEDKISIYKSSDKTKLLDSFSLGEFIDDMDFMEDLVENIAIKKTEAMSSYLSSEVDGVKREVEDSMQKKN